MKSKLLTVVSLLGAMGAAAPVCAAQVIINGGFETGSLSPWVLGRTEFARDPSDTANEWMVTNANANTGTYSAEVNDNFELVQDFAPVSVAGITNVSFAAFLPTVDPYMAVELFYSGGVDEEYVVDDSGGSWQTFNITSDLDHGQSDLVGISFFGNSFSYIDPGNPSYLDDVSIISTVPEPATWAMLIVAFGGLGLMMRRVGRKSAARLVTAT